MDVLTGILSGFGLAAPAGLNAWLPLLITGLAGRFHLFGFKLTAPFDILTQTPTLMAFCLILFIVIFADKIPAIESINDMIHTFIRPVAGGILFAANNGNLGSIDPAVAFILGLLSAGSVHAVKATSRPLITATTAGIGNPIVSSIEDFIAAIATILAIAVPILAAIVMGLILALAAFVVFRFRARRRRRRQAEI
jgi:hypothetical protein